MSIFRLCPAISTLCAHRRARGAALAQSQAAAAHPSLPPGLHLDGGDLEDHLDVIDDFEPIRWPTVLTVQPARCSARA